MDGANSNMEDVSISDSTKEDVPKKKIPVLRVLEKDKPKGINVLVKKTRQKHRIPNSIIKDQKRENS